MKLIPAVLLFLATPLIAQTVAPSQIKPGSNGQVMTTVSGKTAWAPGTTSVSSVFGRTGNILPVTGDYNCSQITSAICSLPSLFNQTVDVDGSPLPQRPLLNFINGTAGSVSCVDNPVTGATDCTITGGSTTGVTWHINDVSGSRTVGVPKQNTTTWPMYVGGSLATSGSGTGSILVAQGTSMFSLPLIDWKNQSTATVSSGSAGFSAVINPGYWYVVQVSGAVTTTIQSWTEMTGSGTGGGGGGGSGPTIETNGTPNTSQAMLNGVNANGLQWSNPSGGVWNIGPDSTHFLPLNTSGTSCFWNGGGTCTTPSGSGTPFAGSPGIPYATSTSASRAANAADITNLLGYTPYQTPTLTGNLVTNVLADYNFSQGSGTVLADTSGANACSSAPCNGTLGSGANAPTWLNNGLSFTYGQDQNVSLPMQLNAGETFSIEFYYAPVTSVPGSGGVNASFTPLINSSLGTAGINFIFHAPAGNQPEDFGEPSIWNSSLITQSLNFTTGLHNYTFILGTGGSNKDRIFIDGTEVPYQVQGATAGAQTSGHLFFGSGGVGPWVGSGGQFIAYRMRVFSSQLTPSDVMQLNQIFKSDLATRGVATSPTPISIGQPLFHFIGDSLTAGQNVTTPFPNLLTLTNQPSYQILNWGIGGTNIQALTASEPNRVGQQCQPTVSGPAVANVWAGTNDLSSGASVAQVWAALGGEIAVLKQAGCIVFVSTMIDRTTPNLATQEAQYNALIRTGAKALGADGITDFAADPVLGAAGASTNATYFSGGGGIHWNNAGEARGVLEVNNAVNYYFGANAAAPTIVTATSYTMAAGDGYLNVQPTANTTVTLPDCLGQTGAIYRLNMLETSTFTLTVKNSISTEPINGTDYSSTGLVALNGPGTVSYTDVANPSAAAGCHWDSSAAPSAGAVSSVSNSDGTLTITPTTGAVVASLALGHANTWSGQQTFVAPILGTPASATLTNATGLPISTGVSGLGTNVATFLATPNSANLGGAITDETGTGFAVFSASPALTGSPTAPTQTANDNSTKLATTAYVDGKTRFLSCQPGLGDGLNAIPNGTYLTTTCRNETGATWTITAIRCVADAGASTCNVTNGAGTALLTTAITGTSTYANGTQSGTTTIASGDFLKITYVADGTSKQIGIDVAGTY